VAGESPDRSKQHESLASSAEPTPATPAAVPGPARGAASASASTPADPRMAVARERATTVRVDQATAVFSTKALATPEAEKASEADEKSAEGDSRLRAAVAAWVTGPDDAESGAEGAAGASTDADADAETAETSEASDESGKAPGEASDGASAPDAKADADVAADLDTDAEEAQDSTSGKASVADESGDEPEAGSDSEAESVSEGDAKAADGPKGEDDTGAEAEEDTEADGETETETESAPDADADTASGDEPKSKADDATSDRDPAPEPPVDQPTAIFKAPRPPAVDQPTTMLKLGGATKPTTDKPADKPADKAEGKPEAKPEGKPEAKPADKATPESDPERTSKFVALKPLDEPAPAKPKTTPAWAAGNKSATAPAPKTVERPTAATAAIPQVGPERTTQQPLPPKPPLDLLAELTNTPPPPQTPVRTIVRRIKIWTPLVLLLALIFAVVQAVRPLPTPALTLTASDTYTFKGGTLDLPWPGQGQSTVEVEGVGSLGTEGKQSPAPIASVAKIMTAYVILQEHPLKGNEGGEKITVDQQAEDESKLPDESTAAMSKGQQFTERQMLQMLMIPSGNNAARLLARWDSDNQTFVAKMNAAAKKLGMTNTTYTDPSGLQKTTVSTATDQLELAKAVMQKDVFRSVVGMASAKIPGLDSTIYNNNDLLVKQVGVIGLKTGSSTPAGGNLVWAATKTVNGKQQTIYGAVLNQNAGTGKVWDSLQLALTNSQKLIDKVQQSLTSATVVKKGDVVGYVDDQLGGRTPVVATKNMTAIGWPGLKTKLSLGVGSKTVPHSGKAGTVVGELTVGDGSSHAVKIPVALQSDLAEPGFGAKLTRVS